MMTPLTRSQELLWTGQALAGQAPLYNQAWRFDLIGRLEPELFASAFDRLTKRADIMRTIIRETKDGVVQEVLADAPIVLERINVATAAHPEEAAAAFIHERSRKPFDLASASYDAVLLELGGEHRIFFFSQHHIVTDAWSVAVLFEALAEHIRALRSGDPMPSDPLPAFQDFVKLESGQRASEAGRQAADHWRRIADTSAGPLRLYDRRNDDAAATTERLIRPLTADRQARLQALAETKGVRSLSVHLTHFNLFMTAFIAYLSRVSGRRQLTTGAPAHNRTTPALRGVAGLLVEVFPFAAELDEDETFRSLFAKVSATNMDNMRFTQAGAASAESGRAFNTVLNYIPNIFPEIDGITRRVEWLSTGAMDPGHDFRLHVMDMNGDGVPSLAFDLNTSAFPGHLRDVIPAHFEAMFDAMLEDFDRPIDEVSLLTPAERIACLEAFNDVPPARSADETPLSLFARAVASSSGEPVVRFGETVITYEELDQWSDAIAHDLIAEGIIPGSFVAIHMQRSPAYVASVLGVMKAGAAFVPLDAGLPKERLAFILEDARAAAIVTEPSLVGRLEARTQPILVIDGMTGGTADASLPAIAPDDTAYMIYTSGSTGTPKGVAVGHGAFGSYLAWAASAYAGGRAASMPLFTAIGFDLTLTSLFVPLISGGSVVVYPEPDEGADLAVLDVLDDDRVDIVKLTPAHLALATEHARSLERIHTLILGGEDLRTRLAKMALDTLGDHLAIYNEYGPTEAVIGCMIHRFDPKADVDLSVPIGSPADGMRIYVLDAGLHPVPEGVAGEIYIGGNRLAKGYHGRGALTAERFVDDPFVPGGRLYRTGDLARFDDRQRLTYLGRADRQVKLRGVRIELGEIEQALTAVPGIRDAVVIARTVERERVVAPEVHCVRCGLSSAYPETTIDDSGVCSICSELESYCDRAAIYFGDMDALQGLLDDAGKRARGDYDCIMLTSGGKDSIYALARLADMGPRVLALTLDNGYLSDGAKENIERVTESLGVDHRYVSTPAMNAIFVDSLQRHANVCNGCFKTIYTLAMQTALEVGAPIIVTGLSRGQFFETRLTPDLFKSGDVTCGAIETMVKEARKAYHRTDDAVSQLLDVDMFRDDDVFDQVEFVDFYRYCDVSLDQLYRYLHERLPWRRPADTGRSSNCLINDAGIYVHKRRAGFHNYALPYSWDVRMGHKQRDAALEELNDDIDVTRVRRMLDEIGYDASELFETSGDLRLVAYVVSEEELTPATLRSALRDRLPQDMIPTRLVRVDTIPLTANGKVDRSALPDPDNESAIASAVYRAPSSEQEVVLAEIWTDVLRVERVGVDDNFYDLGGDSIAAIRIAARARKRGIDLPPSLIFQHQTLADLADITARSRTGMAEEPEDDLAPFALAGLGADGLDAIAAALGSSPKSGS